MQIGHADLKARMWVLAFLVGATGPCFAQVRHNFPEEMTKEDLKKSLESLKVKLEALRTPQTERMVTHKVKPEEEKRWKEAEALREDRTKKLSTLIENFKAPDVRIEALEVPGREGGVARLQRHQNELTTQKLGTQVIILPNP